MTSSIQDFVKNYGEISEFDLNTIFTKSGNLTKRTIGLKTKSLALVRLMKQLKIVTKADYEAFKAKLELDNYEKVHGKISAKDIASVYNKDGTLTKRVTKKNEQLVRLMTKINANKKTDFNAKINKVSEIETNDNVNKEPKVFDKKPIKAVAKKPVKKPAKKPMKKPIVKVEPEAMEPLELEGPVQETFTIKQLDPNAHIEEQPDVLNEEEQDYIDDLSKEETYKEGITISIGTNFNVRYNKIKQTLIEYLDSHDLSNYYFKYHVEGFDKFHWTTIPMNSDNIPKIKSFLERESFLAKYANELDDALNEIGIDSRSGIDSSDGLKLNETKLTIDMIDKITIAPKAFGKKESKTQIYCDNGGAFYDAKLKPESAHLEQFTKRYQIFATQLDPNGEPREEYKYNCLTWAFKQSGQFDEKTLEAIIS